MINNALNLIQIKMKIDKTISMIQPEKQILTLSQKGPSEELQLLYPILTVQDAATCNNY